MKAPAGCVWCVHPVQPGDDGMKGAAVPRALWERAVVTAVRTVAFRTRPSSPGWTAVTTARSHRARGAAAPFIFFFSFFFFHFKTEMIYSLDSRCFEVKVL